MDVFKLKKRILDGIFGVYVLGLLGLIAIVDYHGAIEELLINYQGGFVRRGLLGEILLFLAKHFPMDIAVFIKIFCMVFFVLVNVFFIRAFRKRNYSLYLLSLCFFLAGSATFWIRRDYLMIFCFITLIAIYAYKQMNWIVKISLVNVLAVLMILIHEVFAFFTLPALFLLITKEISDKKYAMFRSLCCLLPAVITFLAVILFKGTPETAQAIWDSWSLHYSGHIAKMPWSIDAIGWDTINTMLYHIRLNFRGWDNLIVSSLVWLGTFPLVYYISTNFLWVFKKKKEDFTENSKTVLSSILIFQLFCLSPVFLVLCCDYGRLFFFWTASSFALFLLVPQPALENLFPAWYKQIVAKINNGFVMLAPPSKTLITVLMMVVSICPVSFIIQNAYETSVIYQVLRVLSKPFLMIINLIL